MTKITAISLHTTGEGTRAAYTYSTIDDNGAITAQNQRGALILVDEDALAAANTLFSFLQSKVTEE